MADKITLDVEMAEAFKAYKEAETLYNFYKSQLLEKIETEGANGASYDFPDGSKVKVEYVPQVTAKTFDSNKAKKMLPEILGENYKEEDYYKDTVKSSHIRISLDY